MIDIRELHLLAFGERVAEWYDEACTIWRTAYGQPDDPPVLLLPRGGYSGYGKSYADAGPAPIDGRLTHYMVRLFANKHTRLGDKQFRHDLIAHELGHVYEFSILHSSGRGTSTHDTTSWRFACTIATPYLLPELSTEAEAVGVTLASIFNMRASRVQRCNGNVTRVPIPGALQIHHMATWPHVFREAEGRAAFVAACHAVAAQQQRNVPGGSLEAGGVVLKTP